MHVTLNCSLVSGFGCTSQSCLSKKAVSTSVLQYDCAPSNTQSVKSDTKSVIYHTILTSMLLHVPFGCYCSFKPNGLNRQLAVALKPLRNHP